MEIRVITMGRTSTPYIRTGIELFVERLRHYVPFVLVELPDIRTSRKTTEARQKEEEGMAIMQQLTPADCVVLLDERGREYTSREFAEFVSKKMVSGLRRLVFVVGGPYGFSKQMYERADGQLSLSRMTFSHEMVRLFFCEQVYRAMTILRGEPYHHD